MAPTRMQPPSRNGSVPNPDPTDRTIEQLLREIATSREIVEAKAVGQQEVVETRFNGMDKAIELLQKSAEKIPQYIKESIAHLESLHDEKFRSFVTQIDIQFDGISTQFQERDKRTEQLSIADKTAIAAALQAQKEAAGAQNESNTTANTKTEMNFAKLIDQTQTLLQAVTRNTDDKINDLKSRFDKGEGKSSVSDPQTTFALDRLSVAVAGLDKTSNIGTGSSMGMSALWGIILGAGGFIFGLATFIGFIMKVVK